jgi:hypothetical protein
MKKLLAGLMLVLVLVVAGCGKTDVAPEPLDQVAEPVVDTVDLSQENIVKTRTETAKVIRSELRRANTWRGTVRAHTSDNIFRTYRFTSSDKLNVGEDVVVTLDDMDNVLNLEKMTA